MSDTKLFAEWQWFHFEASKKMCGQRRKAYPLMGGNSNEVQMFVPLNVFIQH
jgi:hypothetical protein